jgi:ketosteroid isomerase-like protein
MTDVAAAARRWADVWARAWREHDVDAIATLYADEAVHRSAPFRDAGRGPEGVREYVEWAFADEERAETWFGEPVVTGDRAAVEWWAVSEAKEPGPIVTLAGASLIRFGADGLVREQYDYWNEQEGRREPPEGFGR